jgi:AcrR family transcriptional regulator
MTRSQQSGEARDRLLVAAARLLHESGGEPVSTRAICAAAGVQAPTLYHHFGSKQALLDAVISHGFRAFLATRDHRAAGGDPLAAIRQGWDTHVAFGLAHPAFYAHIYGHVEPGTPCGVVGEVERMLREALLPAARRGLLRVPPEQAAAAILAASSGVTLALMSAAPGTADRALSDLVRDATLAAITTGVPAPSQEHHEDLVTRAIALDTALAADERAPLTPSERALLHEWLRRLSARGT